MRRVCNRQTIVLDEHVGGLWPAILLGCLLVIWILPSPSLGQTPVDSLYDSLSDLVQLDGDPDSSGSFSDDLPDLYGLPSDLRIQSFAESLQYLALICAICLAFVRQYHGIRAPPLLCWFDALKPAILR